MNKICSLLFTDSNRVLVLCPQKMHFRKTTFFLPEQTAIVQLLSLFEAIDKQFFKITF